MSAFLNTYLIAKWKYKMHGKLFWIRNLTSSSISEILATFVAGILTFLGLIPLTKIIIIMSNAVILKLLYGVIAVWPTSFIAYLLKKKESEITINPTFNPLKF